MSRNVFVGNLPFSVREEELEALFAGIGSVHSVKIIRDRYSGRSRGFGFVEMSTEEEARMAIDQLNGHVLDGRSLRVDLARGKGEMRR